MNVAWSEVRGIKLACLAGVSSPQQSQLGTGPSQSSPVSISSCNLAEDSGLDWDEPVCQEKLLKSLTTIRVQVGHKAGMTTYFICLLRVLSYAAEAWPKYSTFGKTFCTK